MDSDLLPQQRFGPLLAAAFATAATSICLAISAKQAVDTLFADTGVNA